MSVFKGHSGDVKASVSVLPVLYIEPVALKKMQVYCEECSKEIGWLGIVDMISTEEFICRDVVLLHQDVGAATTEIQPEGLIRFAEECGDEEIISKMYLWGHSHVNMGVSPSGQDDTQVEMFKDNGFEYCFRVIANKKGEFVITYYDFKSGVKLYNVEWALNIDDDVDREEIKAEISEKVKEKTYTSKYVSPYRAPSRDDSYDDIMGEYMYGYSHNSNINEKKTSRYWR